MAYQRDLRLPDFLIIGAMKSGTSALHRYLGSHPGIFTSAKKELDFFKVPGGDLRDYAAHFASASETQLLGESSPNYLKAHQFPGVADRIATTLPEIRLVCVLRNPISRAVSHYNHNYTVGRERRPLGRALLEDERYLMTSRYAWQLRPYLECFDRQRLHVLRADELLAPATRERTVREVLRFLGADVHGELSLHKEKHVTEQKVGELRRRDRRWLERQLRADVGELRDRLGVDVDGWGIV